MIYYDEKLISRILEKYFQCLIKSDDLFSKISSESDIHYGGIYYEGRKGELIADKERISTELQFSYDDMVNYEIEEFCVQIYNALNSRIKRMHEMLIGSINEITSITGNTIDAEGKEFSYDLILDMLEKIDIDFNENGEAILPTILMSDKMMEKVKEIQPSETQENRLREIIEEKKKEYYAQKHIRKLSFIS